MSNTTSKTNNGTDIEMIHTLNALRAIADTLPERDKNILVYRFGLGSELSHTLNETCEYHNVKRVKVRELETYALNKIKAMKHTRPDTPVSDIIAYINGDKFFWGCDCGKCGTEECEYHCYLDWEDHPTRDNVTVSVIAEVRVDGKEMALIQYFDKNVDPELDDIRYEIIPMYDHCNRELADTRPELAEIA